MPEERRHLSELQLSRCRTFDQREERSQLLLRGDQCLEAWPEHERPASDPQRRFTACRIGRVHSAITGPELSRLIV
jgi:hypothetical protein